MTYLRTRHTFGGLACLFAAFALAGCRTGGGLSERPSSSGAAGDSAEAFALFPEHELTAAIHGSDTASRPSFRSDPREIASRFASRFLGWVSPEVELEESPHTITATLVHPVTGARIDLQLARLTSGPDYWVISVGSPTVPPPSVSVRGGVFSATTMGGTGDRVHAQIVKGERTVTANVVLGEPIRVKIGEEGAGFFLLTYLDGDEVIAAFGSALPALDFAAG